MTYVGQSGSTESGSVLWTNEANWATTNDPGKISLHNWEADLGISMPVAEPIGSGAVVLVSKYLDVRLSEMHGIPIYTRLHSGARRNVTPAGYVFGRHRQDLYKSPASSSSSYQQNGGAGGNTLGVYVPKIGHSTRNGKIIGNGSCKKGYHPRWHRHKNGDISAVCVPNSLKGKRIRFE